MTRKTLLMLAVLTALSAGTAFAATAPASDSQHAPRAKLDANGDGASIAAKRPSIRAWPQSSTNWTRTRTASWRKRKCRAATAAASARTAMARTE